MPASPSRLIFMNIVHISLLDEDASDEHHSAPSDANDAESAEAPDNPEVE